MLEAANTPSHASGSTNLRCVNEMLVSREVATPGLKTLLGGCFYNCAVTKQCYLFTLNPSTIRDLLILFAGC